MIGSRRRARATQAAMTRAWRMKTRVMRRRRAVRTTRKRRACPGMSWSKRP